MKPIKNFAERLRDILSEKHLSASELSRKMQFNSRNSLFRILNNEASYEKQKDFLQKLKAAEVLELSPREWDELEDGLEVSRVGVDGYVSNLAMKELVMYSNALGDPIRMISHMAGTDQEGEFVECFRKVFKGEKTELLIVGCCDLELFKIIEQLIMEAHQANKEVEITHYIEASGVELVHVIASIQPVIFADCYQAYMLEDKVMTDEIRALYRCNMMLASYIDEQGCQHFLHFMMSDYGCIHGCEYKDKVFYSYLKSVLTEHSGQMVPIKAAFMQPVSPEDYLWYTEQYGELEKDSNLYDIKGDVPINYIHPDILLGPVREGFKESGFGQDEMQEQLIAKLYEIQYQRWQNFFEKRKVTHTIFTYESMRKFALTGLQSDHFFAMRPYTKHERKEILRFLKEQTSKNPYFTIYFFKQGLEPAQNEIGIYEGKGVLLTKAHTDYKLDDGHAEALITQSEFCLRFKEYFLKQLLVHNVTSAKETLAIMDELINLCDKG